MTCEDGSGKGGGSERKTVGQDVELKIRTACFIPDKKHLHSAHSLVSAKLLVPRRTQIIDTEGRRKKIIIKLHVLWLQWFAHVEGGRGNARSNRLGPDNKVKQRAQRLLMTMS